MRLGFIGLGRMGGALAANLVGRGYELVVWNRSPDPVRRLVDLGAKPAGTAQVAAKAEVVISMLADDASLKEVFIDHAVIDAIPAGSLHINMATASIRLALEFGGLHADRGVGYVAAPVIGRPDVAQAAKLHILAAGADRDIEAADPILRSLGQRIWRFGTTPASANAAKLAMNLMIASAIEATAEAMTLASAYDIAPANFIDLATSTLFPVPVYQGYGRSMAEGAFEPAGFKSSLGLKDIRLVLEAGEAVNAPLPFASVLKDNLLDALAHGQEDMDWASLALVSARRAGRTNR